MVVYKAKNIINEKFYIGKTSLTIEKRRSKHLVSKRYSNSAFHQALRKYGRENFIWNSICHCVSKGQLNEQEMFYIWYYDNISPKGYNLTFGGDGGELSIEARQKNRERMIGKKLSEDTKNKISQTLKDRKQSDETKDKRARKHKGRKNSTGTIQKMREIKIGDKNPMFGKNHSEEAKRKISEKNKGNNLCAWSRGKKLSEEHREKLSLATKEWWKKRGR